MPSRLVAQQSAQVRVGNSDFGGVVSGPNGPEAGVWVIAETTDLPTKLAKMVVTDDQGRYLLPELPKANYNIWVRGYGLVDSPKVKSEPGKGAVFAIDLPLEARPATTLGPRASSIFEGPTDSVAEVARGRRGG